MAKKLVPVLHAHDGGFLPLCGQSNAFHVTLDNRHMRRKANRPCARCLRILKARKR